MARKLYSPAMIGVLFVSMILVSAWNVKANEESHTTERPYETERTMIKQILNNQNTIISLLQEIKAAQKN